MDSYSYKLASKMKELGYDKDYIQLCVQYADRLIANNAAVIFDPTHLSLVCGFARNEILALIRGRREGYCEVRIPKRSSDFRILELPEDDLKKLQKWILEYVLEETPISKYSMAFKKGLSILDNARPHLRKECLISLDISDFFGSISSKRVHLIFRDLGYTKEMASLFTKICTYKNHLPQGGPTSPYLANLACKSLDQKLSSFLLEKNISYTRYADDLTFSGKKEITNYLKDIQLIINAEGFNVNSSKTRIRFQNQRQIVTGIIVNQKLGVPKETIKKLRQEIYFCKKYGVNGHMRVRQITKSGFKEHLYGTAYYIKMVSPKLGRTFLKQLNEIQWEY